MPHTYDADFRGLKIKTRFVNPFRNIWPFLYYPYTTGKRARINVWVSRLEDKSADPNKFEIIEQIGENEVRLAKKLIETKSGRLWSNEILGVKISQQGSYKIFLRYPSSKRSPELLLMDAEIRSNDLRAWDCCLISMGCLPGLLCGLLGLIAAILQLF